MKTLAVIVAFYIGLLNVLPSMEMIGFSAEGSCCSTSCTAADAEDVDADNDDDGCDDFCNPFMSCATCSGYTIPSSSFIYLAVEECEDELTEYLDSYSKQYIRRIWHPPQFG